MGADRYRGRRGRLLNGPRGFEPTGFEEWLLRARESDRRGDTGAAITQYEEALRKLHPDAEDPRAVDVLRHLGSAYRERGEVQRAERRYEESFEMASRIGYIDGMADAANWLGVIAIGRGDFDTAERFFADARIHATSNDHVRLTGAIDMNLGTLANLRGDLNAAMFHYKSARNQFARHDVDMLDMVLNNTGLLSADRDRFDDAERAFDDAFRFARQSHNMLLDSAIEASRADATRCEDRLLAAETARELGDLFARAEAWTEARTAYDRALQEFLMVGARLDCADVERRIARLPAARTLASAAA